MSDKKSEIYILDASSEGGNSRKLRAIWASEKKNDKKDAEMIARIARFDKKIFYPIRHKGKKNRATLAVLKSRDTLVKSRTLLINSIRGMLKSMGIPIPSGFLTSTFSWESP